MSGKRKYVWHEGAFVDVTNWKPPPRKTPYIIRDGSAPMVHPATGQVFDSKSEFRKVTKAHGLTEMGNDIQTKQTIDVGSRAERKRDIATAIQQLEQGYTPPPVDSVADWGGETRVYE